MVMITTIFSFCALIFTSMSFAALPCREPWGAKIISLSGPMTHVLFDLGLGDHQDLMAISTFAGLSPKATKAKLLAGGMYLSSEYLKTLSFDIIFYDDNDIQRKALEGFTKQPLEKKIENIKTLGQTPFETVDSLIVRLKNLPLSTFQKKTCQEHLEKRRQYWKQVEKGLIQRPTSLKTIFVFLGSAEEENKAWMMVQDGFVKWGLSHKKWVSYDTPLAYARPSPTLLKRYLNPQRFFLSSDHPPFHSWSEALSGPTLSGQTLRSPIILTPGIGQIYTLQRIFQILQ